MLDKRGLSALEARQRLAAEGYNEIASSERRSVTRIVMDVLREPMLALLIGGGLVYLALGDTKEALVLLAFAMISVWITVMQETRTERVLETLRDLTSPRALVIRDGQRSRIAGRDVVRDDLIVLEEGDRIPADAVLLESSNLQADESLLTGESVPVRKLALVNEPPTHDRPGGDDLPFVYSGSLVVGGTGIAKVIATGSRTELGKIGRALTGIIREPPRLQTEIRRIVRVVALIGLAVSAFAVLLYGMLRGDWFDALLAGIAIGMSLLPEEFTVVLTVFMTMGAWRISKARVLTRRAAAIEALGAAAVLCTDKTGTLTENRMTVVELRLRNGQTVGTAELPPDGMPSAFHDLMEFSVLASPLDPFDPMEKAIHSVGRAYLRDTQSESCWRLVHTYGLSRGLLAVCNVWRSDAGGSDLVVAAKGAPEAIAELSHLSAVEVKALTEITDAMAARGLRVIGVARATYGERRLPASQREFDFEFLGLIGLSDPLRPGVREAVAECQTAGIAVVMVTGDYPATAAAIARQAGLTCQRVISGDQLAKMRDEELARAVQETTVFARIMPEQKLRIVNAFKANGHIVAMTGDGVNDAPSLKAADIGVAMGGRGTDVAREASSIVLLDDDFGSIVQTIRLGRRVYDNLRKAMAFIIAVHVPIAGLALLPLAFGLPIILGPMHIALLEMVIDPVCSLVFEAEAEENDIMRRNPRPPEEPLLPRNLIVWSFVQGMFVMMFVASVFVAATSRDLPENEVRALAFNSLVVGIIVLVLVNRSFSASIVTALRRPNWILAIVVAAVLAALGLTTMYPLARDLFNFGPLHASDFTVVFAGSLVLLVLLEGLKVLYSRTMMARELQS